MNGNIKDRTVLPNGQRDSAETKSSEPRPLRPSHSPIDWEIPRKVFHSTPGLVTIVLYFLRPKDLSVIITPLSTALVIVMSADVLRLHHQGFAGSYERLLGCLMRESEKTKLNGVVWYMIGVITVLSAYPRDVAVASILLLSWADTAASIFGRLYGPKTGKLPSRLLGFIPLLSRKSVAGSSAALLVGFLVSVIFWGVCTSGMGNGLEEAQWQWNQGCNGGWPGLMMLGVGAGLITSLIEAMDLGSLDDNLTLPVLGGGALWGWLKLLGSCSLAF